MSRRLPDAPVARELTALSKPLVPSLGPVTRPRLRLIATGRGGVRLSAKSIRSWMATTMSVVLKEVFPIINAAPGAIPV